MRIAQGFLHPKFSTAIYLFIESAKNGAGKLTQDSRKLSPAYVPLGNMKSRVLGDVHFGHEWECSICYYRIYSKGNPCVSSGYIGLTKQLLTLSI